LHLDRASGILLLEVEMEDLRAVYEAARKRFETERTQEAMDAVKAAWAAYDAAGPKRKVSGFASRAGRRQAAERRAMSLRRR
jgi:hypothetical protein